MGAMRKSTHTPEYALLRRRLKETRISAGLTQRQLASELQVPHSWVAKVKAGERRIDLIEFSWFCAACSTSPGVQAAKLLDELEVLPAKRARRRARPKGGDQR